MQSFNSLIKKTASRREYLAQLALLFLLLAVYIFESLYTDEAEHLHCSYLIVKGIKPFSGFWEHHLPTIWYIYAPLMLLQKPALVLLSARVLSFAFVAVSFIIIKKIAGYAGQLFVFSGLFVMILYPHAQLRPEIITLPVYALLVLYLSGEYSLTKNKWLTGILFGICFTVTPRFYFPSFIFLLFYLYDNRKQIAGMLPLFGGVAVTVIVFLLLFNYKDILFFCFQQTSQIRKVPLSADIKRYMLYSILISVIYVYNFGKKDTRLQVLKLVLLFSLFIDKHAYISQSTCYIIFVDILLSYKLILLFSDHVKIDLSKSAFIFYVGMFLIMIPRLGNMVESNIFADFRYIDNKVSECAGASIQTNQFQRYKDYRNPSYVVHPIFMDDASYFGFFLNELLTPDNIKKVQSHNTTMGRHVEYVYNNRRFCYFDPSIKNIFVAAGLPVK